MRAFLLLTLAVTAFFSMIKTGRRLRLTAIKARVTVFLFVPPSGRFFCPENEHFAAGIRYRVPEALRRGLDMEDDFRGIHPGQTSRMAEKIPKPGQRRRDS